MANTNQLNKETFVEGALKSFNGVLPLADVASVNINGNAQSSSSVRVELVGTAGDATVTSNPASTPSYTSGDSTNDSVEVSLARIHKSAHITDAEVQTGEATLGQTLPARTENSMFSVAKAAWTKIMDVVKTFTAVVTLAADEKLDDADVRTARKSLNDAGVPFDGRFLVLKDATDLIPSSTTDEGYTYDPATGKLTGAHGFKIVEAPALPTVYVGSGASRKRVIGFLGHKSGIAIAARPALASGDKFSMNEAVVAEGSIAVGIRTWYDANTTATWSTVETLFGAAAGVAGVVKIIVIADPAS